MNLAARLGDRLNPILVKEVRASLRGRVFRILLSIVALGSVAITMLLIADRNPTPDDEGVGRQLFGVMYLCLCVAVLGFVPILAFVSMGGEHDENTYELLEISNLRPRQIVLGKLCTAGIEAALYTSVFAPLLVFAFLLRGVDILNALIVLSWAILASLSASAIALGLSSLTRIRALRVVLLAIVAGGCVGLIALMWNLAEWVAFSSWRSGRIDVDEIVITYVTIVGFGLLGTVIATERVTHTEENHSTAPRLFVASAVIVCQVWIGFLASHGGLSRSDVVVGVMLQVVGLTLFHVFFVTEREELPRRVRLDVPRNPVLAFLMVPFLPGGGRGVLCFLVATGAVLLGSERAMNMLPSSRPAFISFLPEDPERALTLTAYFWILLAGVSLLTMRWTNPREGSASRGNRTLRRWLSRLLIPVVFLAALLGPPMLSFLLGSATSSSMDHPLNPFWTMGGAYHHFQPDRAILVVEAIAVLVFLANLPRIVRSVGDVLRASAENRARGRGTAT